MSIVGHHVRLKQAELARAFAGGVVAGAVRGVVGCLDGGVRHLGGLVQGGGQSGPAPEAD